MEKNIVYTKEWRFIMRNAETGEEITMPKKEMYRIGLLCRIFDIKLDCVPLTEHPKLKKVPSLLTTKIVKVKKRKDFWDVTTQSGTTYRLML